MMDTNLNHLDKLFNPKHIAFIGASESSAFGSMLYLKSFQESIWKDTFYPINPKREKILSWKCYPSVLNVPYPIDTAYISLKINYVLQAVRECVEKKIPWIVIFASGFSETGEVTGKKLEQELMEIIKKSNSRIVGPNCLGPYNSDNGFVFSTSFAKGGIPGTISFMSQSGGHVTQLLDVGNKRDIRFRYGVSFGNQIDLNCLDFIRLFREEPKTKIIVAYLESFGSANGHEFFLELQKTIKLKPVILWKGGYTEDGSKAAFSHTGALASNLRLWETMVKQTGATLVKDSEEWWNAMKTFELLFPKYIPNGRNIVIVTPGGGSSVSSCDLFASFNLKVPELTSETQTKVAQILPKENVNIKNPIDMGALGFVVDVFIEIIEMCAEDPNIDIVIVPLWPQHMFSFVFKRMFAIQAKSSKPFVYCIPSISDSQELAPRFNSIRKFLNKNRILYFLSLRDAAKSVSLYCDYIDYMKSHNYKI